MHQVTLAECSNGKCCLVCFRKYKSAFQCQTNTNPCKDDQLFRCGYCNNIFKLKYTLARHQHIHTGGRTYKYDDCKK